MRHLKTRGGEDMRTRTTLLGAGTLLAVIACGGSGTDATVDKFVEGCLSSTNLERAFCECAAGNASEELSPEGFAFVAATFTDDDEAIEMLRNELSMTEAVSAGMFMVNAYKDCAPATE